MRHVRCTRDLSVSHYETADRRAELEDLAHHVGLELLAKEPDIRTVDLVAVK